MNRRLLFMAFLASMAAANKAQAQTLTIGDLPKKTLACDGTDSVYIAAKGSDGAYRYLSHGLNWNTQACFVKDISLADAYNLAKSDNKNLDGNQYGFYLKGVNFQKNKNRLFVNDYTAETGTSYVDMNNQTPANIKSTFVIYNNIGGTFQMSADTLASSKKTVGVSIENASYRSGFIDGNIITATSGTPDEGRDEMEMFSAILDTENGDNKASYVVDFEAYDYYRVQLMNAINEYAESGVDMAEAIALAKNDNATSSELKDMATLVKDRVRNANMKGASVSEPYSLTEYITNASCDSKTGWTFTGKYDDNGNVGSGGHGTNWQTQSSKYTATDSYETSKFIERWINSNSDVETNTEVENAGHLSDGEMSQQITNLPAGGYKLSCYAMATHQGRYSADNKFRPTGVSLFVRYSDGSVKETKVATAVAVPEKFEFLLPVTKDTETLTVGFKIENTNANWIFVDNFQMEYYGNDNEAFLKMDLSEAISAAESVLGAGDHCSSYDDMISEAKDAAQALVDSQDTHEESEYEKVKANLVNAKTAAEENAAAYVTAAALQSKYEEYYNTVSALDSNTPEQKKYISLYEDFDGDSNNFGMTLMLYTLETEKLNDRLEELAKLYDEAYKSGIEPGTDLTSLIVNPSYTDGGNGWTHSGGACTYNSTYQNAEKYQGTFDENQTITGLKMGVYRLSVHGFQRCGFYGDGTAKANVGKETAEIYGGEISAPFISPFVYKGMTSASGGSPADIEETDDEGNTYYLPNSMQGFASALESDPEAYLTNVVVLVTEDNGSLKIGVRSKQNLWSGNWCMWDDFKLVYLGNSGDCLAEASAPLLTTAKGLLESAMNKTAKESLQNAINKIEGGQGTMDDILTLNKAISTARASIEVYETLNTALATAETRYNNNEAANQTSAEAKAIYTAAKDKATDVYNKGYEADEYIPTVIDELYQGVVKYAVNDASKTTFGTPVNINAVLVNNDFSSMDATGWTTFNQKSGTNGLAFQSANSVEGAEVYNKNFMVGQQVKGLPEGQYILTVKGFDRASNNAGQKNAEGNTFFNTASAKGFFGTAYSETDSTMNITADGNIQPITAAAIKYNIQDPSDYCFEAVIAQSDSSNLFGYYKEGDETYRYFAPNTMLTAQKFITSENAEADYAYRQDETQTVGDNFISEQIVFNYDGKSDFFVGVYKSLASHKTADESADLGDWTYIDRIDLYYNGVDPNYDPTGINGVNDGAADNTTGTLDGPIYTLSGQKVTVTVPGEVYIQNGKKFIAK